ncbi:alkaline phosphatase family protein [Bacillus sp. JCM 19041]|uniref:alkaline phosphatase family protein n=1 Tax=Bacillus sp. JCM 19041 TaxID=1460637 RepID=UPI000AE424BF
MKKVIILILFLLLGGFYFVGLMTPTKDLTEASIHSEGKPVLFLLIDSLMDQPLQKAIEEGRAPAFEFLIDHGHYYSEIVSSYPTMSVTIDSTLLTGTYADKHKIPALAWYKQDEERLVNYGSGPSEIWMLGIKQMARDSLIRLNEDHLSQNVSTIYEELEDEHIQSASINGLIYRGNSPGYLTIPRIATWLNLLPENVNVNGPTLLSLGGFSQWNSNSDYSNKIWKNIGINDEFSANELAYIIQENQLPSFTLTYFPNLDRLVHKRGPMVLKEIEAVDKELQKVLNTYPTWKEAIQKATWIVYGDSGQSKVSSDDDSALIDLNDLLAQYAVWNPEDKVQERDQLVLAVNARMAYINLLDNGIAFSEIVSQLKKDPRIGFISWKEKEMNYVAAEGSNQLLSFSPNGNYTDLYGQTWDIEGDISLLDLTVNDQNTITYGEYPDAFARLHGALHSHEGVMLL